jgi:hypothetical protein
MARNLIRLFRPVLKVQEILRESRSKPVSFLNQISIRQHSLLSKSSSNFLAVTNGNKNFMRFRYEKSRKNKNDKDEDEDSDDDLEKYADDVDKTKITRIRVQSLR